MIFDDFYRGKRVFITGMSGFKGSWLYLTLKQLGAKVLGYSLHPEHQSFMTLIQKSEISPSEYFYSDIGNYETLQARMQKFKPDIVMHLAAQAIVLKSYQNPMDTYKTNVQGTVNVLEACRHTPSVKLILNITTDKVYLNENQNRAFEESDKLCGLDPYSNSKSCSELVSYSYYQSFFKEAGVSLITLRAGNVIGGGDFAENRIVPDCARALMKDEPIVLRHPNYTRPFQHVLDVILSYLFVGYKMYGSNTFDSFNIGPQKALSVEQIAVYFCKIWGGGFINKLNKNDAPAEAQTLTLSTQKIFQELNWHSLYTPEDAIKLSAQWYKYFYESSDSKSIIEYSKSQINEAIEKGIKIWQ